MFMVSDPFPAAMAWGLGAPQAPSLGVGHLSMPIKSFLEFKGITRSLSMRLDPIVRRNAITPTCVRSYSMSYSSNDEILLRIT